MTWSLRCEGISKLYQMGRTTVTASELVNERLRAAGRYLLRRRIEPPKRTEAPESTLVVDQSQMIDAPPGHFWALKNVDLEINRGDRVGIIGPNGCGKSTLLKILSRITSPDSGSFRFRGRLISLLEIGTGFHPDLTGRENIFLNGSIMGMKPPEIRSRLSEIIEFSELGDMIDTPVKRYSSGMYVRLAFSVAAHLESEILIVDEVLAVGDAGFQRKCTDKMLEVAGEGRTLLFVSHNMDAVNRICNRAVHMSHGRILTDSELAGASDDIASVSSITREYLRSGVRLQSSRSWTPEAAPTFQDSIRLDSIAILDNNEDLRAELDVTEDLTFEITFTILKEKWPVNLHLHLHDLMGHYVLVAMDDEVAKHATRQAGTYVERCTLRSPLLNTGDYRIDVEFWPGELLDPRLIQRHVVTFAIVDKILPGGVRRDWPNEWPNSLTRPATEWRLVNYTAGK